MKLAESYDIRDERLRFIPEHFSSTVTEIATAPEMDAKSFFKDIHAVRTPVWRFRGYGMVVVSSKPVSVHVGKRETLFFAENDNLGIFATGESRNEAIETFCEQLVHFYKHYKQVHWDRVTGEAHRLKKLYEDLFSEIDNRESGSY